MTDDPATRPATRLLDWFDQNQRPLPWRQSRDPYAIWVSEVMLQHTTVAAVGPYFERFLAAFPTVERLAAAPETEVLRLWAGLGYYRRARHLHAAAQQIARFRAEHGTWPTTPEFWAELPGVGRYILGAVLSQAFEAQLPIVEANSLRVLSRWHAYPGDPRQGAGQKWVWQAAAQWLPDQRIGDFNQAVMELGATVCTVTTPRCPECPLRSDCQALALNCVETIPPRPTRPAVTEVLEIAVVLRDSQQRILFARRPPEARRWANFWEVPHGPLHDGETETDAARRILSEQTGLTARIGPTEGEPIVHGVTRWKIVLHIRSASHPHGTLQVGTYTEFAWIEPHEATRYPISSSQKRLIARLTERRLF